MKNELKHYGILGMKWGVRRFQNPDGTLTPAGKKRNAKEVDKEIAKRNMDLFVDSNNYAADRINGKWIEDFNQKWSKEFKDYDTWTDSPKYEEYDKAYMKNLIKLTNEYLKTDKRSEFTTKLGQTYTAGFLEEHGQKIIWATPEEWAEYKRSLHLLNRNKLDERSI